MKKRTQRTILTLIIIAVLVASLLFVLLTKTSLWFDVSLILVALALTLLVSWHSARTRYSCPSCGQDFKIGALKDFFSAHTPSKKLLSCPACQTVDWCEVIN